jgi:hypothetical protein
LTFAIFSNDLLPIKFKKTILSFVLFGCEKWPLAWRRECTLEVSENKGKGKVPVLLTEHHAMKAYWGVEV